MVFGLMRKATHEAIVAELNERITTLERQNGRLQGRLDCQVEPKNVATTAEVVAKPKAAAAPQVQATLQPMSLHNPSVRLETLEALLPKAKFERKGHAISVIFNGKPARVRLSQLSGTDAKGDKRFAFQYVENGDICVTINPDQTLRSVFVGKKHMTTKGGHVYVMLNSVQDLALIQNTGLVLRNFK